MDDAKFIELGNYLLKSMIQGKSIIDLANLIKELRLYINNNPNSIVVKFFIETLLRINLSLFKDAYLLKALEIPDCFAYFRQAKIYENLPYTKHPYYAQFLPELLEIPSQIYGNNYATFMYLLKKWCDIEFLKYIKYKDKILFDGNDSCLLTFKLVFVDDKLIDIDVIK